MSSFVHPSLWIVSGASQSGKSSFCVRLIKHANRLFGHTFAHFYWVYYGAESAVPRALTGLVEFRQGLPADFSDFQPDSLIVIDDCAQEASSSPAVLNLWTRGSHHDRLTVCLVTQNLFHGGKHFRTLHLNTHVYVLFRALRDKGQSSTLFRQISPTHWRELAAIFEAETAKPYSYFVIDLHPANPHNALRYRTHIFPDDPSLVVFCHPSELDEWERAHA